uniref:Reverse transcriptase Ty1/copia-type domain-containing protein n=1 Tax=Chromera velia CCMP2878 TaxID=1169474 RepID=A0A0K6S610_9ALVE|eukprot:Cvel_15776.t1-p1 / transcript=Cvel_15776.t1 / gene=Cvel_15776 / organism=Chromera_velia_CCMP2878 / gene_product=hypothetical protein / transcript_product=hypothetical protein / location=Cvel_scaffold1183:18449-20236(-) / protein_length=411 / sequence_SO=supercontig / SO=protein_coding / is_pseudo=false
MTDHGPEFQGDWCEWLAEREAINPLTPVSSHHSLGKTERSHCEWLTILRGILRDRGLDDSYWKKFASLCTAKYNRQPQESTHKSPFERRWGFRPPSPPIDALRDLLQTSHRPSAETSSFFIGSSVLYHHPDHLRAKLTPLYTSATVLQRISEHVFRLHLPSGRRVLSHRRCIYPNDSPHPNPVYVVSLPSDSPSERPDTSVGSPHQAQQQQPQQSSNIQCPSDQPPSPKFDITDFGKDELILWQDENTGRCFLGSIRAVDPEEVDAEHRRSAVPTHFVDTKKRVEEGSWKYKSRVVADGTPFFDCREGVTTFCATASQSAMRIALAIAFAHSDFDPREIVVADVKTAYLTALRSDSLYVHPPTDYPDHGKFLWLLNRALYGLRDSGNLWDRSRNKTLAAAGWVPSSVRRMW